MQVAYGAVPRVPIRVSHVDAVCRMAELGQ